MDSEKHSSARGKVGRRKFLGAAVLGGICASLPLPPELNAQAADVGGTALKPHDDRIAKLDHSSYMRSAILQAHKNPRQPFGAVIVSVNDGSVVAEGHNRTPINPTYHGEMDAIDQYAAKHPGADWSDLLLYTTCEPCPMCQSAVLWAGIGGVVFGTSMPFIAKLGWWQIDIRTEEVIRRNSFRRCSLIGGVLEEECNALFVAALKLPAQHE